MVLPNYIFLMYIRKDAPDYLRKAHSRPFSRDKRWREAHSVLAREETVDRDLERRVVSRFAFAQKTSGANA